MCPPEGVQEQAPRVGPPSRGDGLQVRKTMHTYNDQDWNPDLSKHTYATIDEDPNILA